MPTSKNGSREHKEHLYELFAQISNALANPHRLELLDLLIQTPRTVEELADQAHMSIANTSQHLQRLKQAHLVIDKRDGQFIRYSLADPSITRLWLDLRGVAERQLAEVEQTLNRYRPGGATSSEYPRLGFRARMERETIVLIDVRPEVEYQRGHLPGSISMPIETFDQQMGELPKGNTIVAYCRGPYCVYADQALELLASRGWQVARLEEGVAEWQEAGYAIEN